MQVQNVRQVTIRLLTMIKNMKPLLQRDVYTLTPNAFTLQVTV